MQEWWSLQQLVHNYEVASGQLLNKEKIAIYFSKSTRREAQLYVLNVIVVHVVHSYEKYLGLPVMIRRRKKQNFKYILDSVAKG